MQRLKIERGYKNRRAESVPPVDMIRRKLEVRPGFDWANKEHVNRLILLVDGFHDFTDISENRSNAYAKQLYLHTKIRDFPGFESNTAVETILRFFFSRTSQIEKDLVKLLELHCPHMFNKSLPSGTKLLQLSIRKIDNPSQFKKGYGQFYIKKHKSTGEDDEYILKNILTILLGEEYIFTTDASPGLKTLLTDKIHGIDLRTRRLDSASKEELDIQDNISEEHKYTTYNLSRGLISFSVRGNLYANKAEFIGMHEGSIIIQTNIPNTISKGPSLGYLAYLISNPLLLKLFVNGTGSKQSTKKILTEAGQTYGNDTWDIAQIMPGLKNIFNATNYDQIQRILYDFKTFGDGEPPLESLKRSIKAMGTIDELDALQISMAGIQVSIYNNVSSPYWLLTVQPGIPVSAEEQLESDYLQCKHEMDRFIEIINRQIGDKVYILQHLKNYSEYLEEIEEKIRSDDASFSSDLYKITKIYVFNQYIQSRISHYRKLSEIAIEQPALPTLLDSDNKEAFIITARAYLLENNEFLQTAEYIDRSEDADIEFLLINYDDTVKADFDSIVAKLQLNIETNGSDRAFKNMAKSLLDPIDMFAQVMMKKDDAEGYFSVHAFLLQLKQWLINDSATKDKILDELKNRFASAGIIRAQSGGSYDNLYDEIEQHDAEIDRILMETGANNLRNTNTKEAAYGLLELANQETPDEINAELIQKLADKIESNCIDLELLDMSYDTISIDYNKYILNLYHIIEPVLNDLLTPYSPRNELSNAPVTPEGQKTTGSSIGTPGSASGAESRSTVPISPASTQTQEAQTQAQTQTQTQTQTQMHLSNTNSMHGGYPKRRTYRKKKANRKTFKRTTKYRKTRHTRLTKRTRS